MFGYGALLDSAFMERLKSACSNFIHMLEGIPLYWYAVVPVLLVILAKLLVRK